MLNDDHIPTFPALEELSEAGVKIRRNNGSLGPGHDLLERFLQVPNHAMFLFTSEDRIIDQYVRDHWEALDGLSGNACDIHVSLLQLQGGEDAYSQLDDIRSIPGLALIQAIDLPALHIWLEVASVTLRLGQFDDEAKLRGVLRAIFSLISAPIAPVNEIRVGQLSSLVNARSQDQVPKTIIHQEVYMEAKYKITGGQQGAVGDAANARDFTQIWTSASSQIDLSVLAKELVKLRGDLSAAASEPDHFVALSEIIAAEKAAKSGDGPTVLQHLKKAGTWVWDVATKVGIGVATAVAKVALGL